MGFWHLGRMPRRPYGRRPQSHPWVEDVAPGTPYFWAFPPYAVSRREDGRVKAVPMPKGGHRLLYRCPFCREWRLYLFNPAAFVFVCRRCMGLRYRSQYVGRRVDASRERIEAARVILERAEAALRLTQHKKEAARRERRATSARLRRQQATWRARRQRLDRAQWAYDQRRDEADMRRFDRVAAYCDRQQAHIQRLAARLERAEKHDVA